MKIAGIEFEVEVDASGVATARTKTQEDLQKLQAEFGKLDGKSKKSGEAMQNMGKKAGAAGIQIQQLVGQIQGGQNVFNALSAQAADLGIVLGAPLVGAVAGLGAAFAGILLPSLFDTEDKTQDLIDKLKELSRTKLLSAEQAKFLAQEESNSIKEKRKLIAETEKEIKENERQIEAMNNTIARNQLGAKAYNNLVKEIEKANQETVKYNATIATANQEIDKSKSKIDIYNSMVEGTTKQTGEQKEAVESLVLALESQANAIGKTNRELAIQEATQKGATQAQIDAINTAFNSIEAEEKRKEAIVQARKDAMIAARMEHEDYKALMAERDALEKERLRKQFEEQQAKDERQSNVDRIRQEIMTERQLMAEKFLVDGEMLRESLENGELTKAEFDAIELDRVAQHQQSLIDLERRAANQRTQIEKRHQDVVQSFRNSAIQNAMGLLDTFAGESKAAAIASIALNKGLALAQNTQNTLVAQTRALSDLGPILGPPMAAKIGLYGAMNAGLIAATGLAQAGGVLSGGNRAASSFSGGVPATTTTQNTSAQGAPQQRNISIAVTGGYGSMEDLARSLIPALSEAIGDGTTFDVNGVR